MPGDETWKRGLISWKRLYKNWRYNDPGRWVLTARLWDSYHHVAMLVFLTWSPFSISEARNMNLENEMK